MKAKFQLVCVVIFFAAVAVANEDKTDVDCSDGEDKKTCECINKDGTTKDAVLKRHKCIVADKIRLQEEMWEKGPVAPIREGEK